MRACQYGVPVGTHAPRWPTPILIVVGFPFCGLLLAAVGEVRARGPAEAAALEPILIRVRGREENVRSLYLAWTEAIVMPKDSPHATVPPGVAAPSADAPGTTAYSLLIDGDRICFSVDGEIWNEAIGQFAPFH